MLKTVTSVLTTGNYLLTETVHPILAEFQLLRSGMPVQHVEH